MSLPELLLYGQAGASVVMFLGWLVALKIRNTSYVDVLWAYGVGILGIVYLYLLREDCHPARHALLLGLLGVWSARLGTHLLRRCWENRKMPATSICGNIWAKKQILDSFSFFRYRHSGWFCLPVPFSFSRATRLIFYGPIRWACLSGLLDLLGSVWQTNNSASSKILPTVPGRRSAIPGCGNIPAIPIIF